MIKKTGKKCAGLFFLVLMIGAIVVVRNGVEGQCVERQVTFREPFDATTYCDRSMTSVDHWGEGYITLNKLGADFSVRNPRYMPNWINTVAAGDFNNDGWPDFVASSSSYSNVLAFVQNMGYQGQSFVGVFDITHWIDGSAGDANDFPTLGVKGAAIDKSGHCALTSGDYDADGDLDFMFIVSQDNPPNFTFKRIWLYENRIVQTGSLSFVQVDKTSAWSSALKGIAWSTTVIVSVDIDKDGDLDILTGNKDGEVLRIINRHRTRAIGHNQKWENPAITVSTGWSPRGVSTLSIEDFDRDGDYDMMLGSVSYPELRYYKNNSGIFSLYKTYTDSDGNSRDNDYDGAATVSIACDFDKDGDIDIMVGTDNWNLKLGGESIGGQVYYFRNTGGEFRSRLIFDNRPTVYDFDLGAYLDFDNDGDNDFLIADGNHSEMYYLFINKLADVYNLEGLAQSVNVTPAINPDLYAITRLRVVNLRQSVVGGPSTGLGVKIFVSNNNGQDWEFYAKFEADEIRDYATLDWHIFEHYGAMLKWKAELWAADDNIPDFPNSSYETPRIDNIEFEIIYVERREYSRTSVAASVVDDSGRQIKLIIGGTFYFPGWQGHLYAYDVTEMTALNTSYSELRTVSRSDLTSPTGREIVAPGVNLRWDAGRLLAVRSADSRNIFTATPDPITRRLTRLDFTEANVDLLDDYLQDFEGDHRGLINFIRGEGREWKLGDINHSNPVVVGPPNQSSPLMGDGYEEFKSAWQNRRKVLYVGANDGMLHCFDVLTGEELWAFIPFNLLPKLRNMWAVNRTTLDRYFNRDVYVDGSPVVADVSIRGNWKTILLCGQGPGKGSVAGGGMNFYFALDVTDPTDPQPLFELTDVNTMGETWSVPAIGKVTKDGSPKWVAFMGSGYDNNPDPGVVLGHTIYAVDLEDGTIFWSFTADEVDTSSSKANNYVNVQNSLPGSPAIIDMNNDGFADRVYIGDLDGRIWRVDLSRSFVDPTSWTCQAIYTDPDHYPIITKPAVWKNVNVQTADPRVFFGTGGDDAAPGSTTYSFVALIDRETGAEVEWFMGSPDTQGIRPAEKDVGDIGVGEKVWADPKIADYVVYFSTLTGSIEAVDPCSNLTGQGKLYGRFIVSYAGSPVGGSAFKTASGPVESLTLAIKTRSAVTLGEQQTTESGIRKREVYIQEYDSTVQKLEQLTGGLIKIKSWREVYKVFKR